MGTHENRAKLRRRAEDQLEPAAQGGGAAAGSDNLRLIHELQVHRLELEMQCQELDEQNNQLRQAQTQTAELELANKELAFQNEEKGKRAAELELANKELVFQNEEKGKRAAELELANKELAFQNEENLRLHEQLFQSQKMESLGILAGGVAHDMNNVLGAILGLSSAMGITQVVESPAWRAFDTITKSATRGGKLVKSLLAFTRNSLAEDKVLNLNDIIQDEVQILAHTTLSKIRLNLDMDSELRLIHGDEAALTHAIMNLCVNAVDAMPEQGTLTFRTRNIDNNWVEVVVEDTGFGMSKAVLQRALDPFFTTKEVGKGTGLGLSVVYRTVKAHGGQLDIQSEPNNGTRVGIRLPASEFAALPQEPADEPRRESYSRALSVLLVDDDDLIQNSITAILELLGHGVDVASSGEEALAKLETGIQPDVVILDMNMPGLGGRGTLPRLRALRPTLPVILSTGRIDQTTIELAEAHAHVTLLSKPFRIGELQEKLGAGAQWNKYGKLPISVATKPPS
jgi:signal transduction histidine kinase/ActR/RegA family two-component response regulator